MAVSKVVKINIIGHKQNEEMILEHLQKLGVVEIEKLKEEEKDFNDVCLDDKEIAHALAEIKFALDFLSEFSKEKQSIRQIFSGTKIEIGYMQLCSFAKNYDWRPVISKVKDLESAINKTRSELEELKKDKEILKPWESLEDNPENSETKFTKIVFGTVSENKYLNLVQQFNRIKPACVKKINQSLKEIFIEVIYRKGLENKVKNILEAAGVKEISLPYQGLAPKKALGKIYLTAKEKNEEISRLRLKTQELVGEFNNLKLIFDFLKLKKERLEGKLCWCAHTNSTFCLVAWIEERLLKGLISDLQKITSYFSISEIQLKDGEERPVVIYNHNYMRPFESVTNLYGLPKYSEVDPTPFLAPFFILFFALCLTDAVYGLFLAIAAFLAIKFLGIPKENQRLIKLLGIGGVVTFIIGALFGGWLGIPVESMPDMLSKPLLAIRLVDPLKNTLLVLGLTLALGIIQIYFGIFVSFYWKMKQKQIKEAILSDAVWLFFLPVICAYGLLRFGVIPESFSRFINPLLYIGVAFVIFTGGRKQKNFLLKGAMGTLKLYSLVGYVSDVLSYSRLLALGLATGIIAMVINLIAGIAFKSVPYFGAVLAILILVFGHIFNLVINVLGAFIHSGRLQFVEFFPKFMEGGGRRFAPFYQNTEFTRIINVENK
ncbi:MAG: V-type ATP synthase subunit I [Candidatus Nealsonbacteria bacterium]